MIPKLQGTPAEILSRNQGKVFAGREQWQYGGTCVWSQGGIVEVNSPRGTYSLRHSPLETQRGLNFPPGREYYWGYPGGSPSDLTWALLNELGYEAEPKGQIEPRDDIFNAVYDLTTQLPAQQCTWTLDATPLAQWLIEAQKSSEGGTPIPRIPSPSLTAAQRAELNRAKVIEIGPTDEPRDYRDVMRVKVGARHWRQAPVKFVTENYERTDRSISLQAPPEAFARAILAEVGCIREEIATLEPYFLPLGQDLASGHRSPLDGEKLGRFVTSALEAKANDRGIPSVKASDFAVESKNLV